VLVRKSEILRFGSAAAKSWLYSSRDELRAPARSVKPNANFRLSGRRMIGGRWI